MEEYTACMHLRLLSIIAILLLVSACTPVKQTPPPPPAAGTGATTQKLSYPQVLVMALNENHDAEFELGAMFHDGDGVEQDFAKALEWYQKAASAGNRQAMFNLGLMYLNAEGTEENKDAAIRLFTRAADAGDARAAFQLGQMSYLGLNGVPQNFTKALQFYTKAAMGGHAQGQLNTGVMYVRGEGMEAPDLVEGYAWLLIAGENKNEKAASLMQTLSAKLTEEQRKKGEQRAGVLRAEIKKLNAR